jgi:hypothetical protein
VSRSLNSLHTALGSMVNLVQLLVVAARHAVDRSGCAQLLVRARHVHAGVALDGSRHVGDIFVFRCVANRRRGQGIGGQALEGEAHVECRLRQIDTVWLSGGGGLMDAKIDQIRQAERAADSYTLPGMEHAAPAGPRLVGPGRRRSL